MMMSVSTLTFAQGLTIWTVLTDKSNNEPVPYATVSLTPEGAQSALKYALSTDQGKVEITGLKKGKYTVKAELLGYKAFVKEITVEKSGDIGAIAMEPDTQMLDAAKVTDVGNPITVKKDTVEYNATLFKQSDNDMLIDLLKKLPGIEVESDGSITANGQTIKKITIDGKTFFLDDPQLATKNIPSKIIEKVKVVEKKSDQAMFTGIDDGEEETIIDLGIKKGMMNGWFGNVMAGGGHDVPSKNNTMNDWRYQGAGFVGNFTDKQQISVILNGNNTNNRGFNDLAGSMMGGMMGGGRGGFGRGNNDGITTSWMGGINGAWSLLDNNMDLGANYLYNGSIKDAEERSIRNTFVNDNETLNYTTHGTNHRFTDGHRVGVRIDHKFSKNTSLLFEPQFNIGRGNYVEDSEFSTTRSYNDGKATEDVNRGFTNNTGDNRNWTASGWGLFRQRLGKEGRTMTVNFRYNFSNNDMAGLNQSLTDTLGLAPEIVNQRYDQTSQGKSVRAGVTYTEPLYKNMLFLEANYSYGWNNQTSKKDTYNSGSNNYVYNEKEHRITYDGKDEVYDPVYSNKIDNTSHNHRAGANLMFQKNKLNAQLGFSANPTKTINTTLNNGTEKKYENNVINWAPQASLRYEIGENNNLRINYWGRSSQPSTNQLMPVPDNSDPLRVSLGNPYLMPYFNHSLRSEYRYTNKKTFTSVNASLDGGMVQNPIINTSWYEDDGRQFSLPTNGPSSYNANMRVMVNSPLGKSKFSIFNMLMFGYNNSSNYVKTGNGLNMNNYYNDGIFDYEKFHDEVQMTDVWGRNFSVNNMQNLTFMERFRLTFRCDLVEINASARTRMSKAWYTITKGNVNPTFNNQVELNMNWNIPGGVSIIPEYSYNWYNGYQTPQQDAHMLNIEISKLLFNNMFTLALKGYDLLGQSRNLNVSDTANYHSETVNNTLGRYVILSLTYRFGNFGNFRGGTGGGRGGYGGPGGGRGGYGGGFGGRR